MYVVLGFSSHMILNISKEMYNDLSILKLETNNLKRDEHHWN